MKQVLFASLAAIFACGGATASDGGIYTETQRYESNTYYGTSEYVRAPRTTGARRVIIGRRPCTTVSAAATPVAVKNYTEVIEHYQVYQPVIEYIPVGTYTTRREIGAPRCGRCNG